MAPSDSSAGGSVLGYPEERGSKRVTRVVRDQLAAGGGYAQSATSGPSGLSGLRCRAPLRCLLQSIMAEQTRSRQSAP